MQYVIYPTVLKRCLYFIAAFAFFFIVFMIPYDDGWLPDSRGWNYYTSLQGLSETMTSLGGIIYFSLAVILMAPFFILGTSFLLASTVWSAAKIKQGKLYFYGPLRFTDKAVFELSTIESIVIKQFSVWCSNDGSNAITLSADYMSKEQLIKFLANAGHSRIKIIDADK
ncbi:hypothetical protein MNBD_GAMMA12-3663 [hydrothermal vent metagenome]|uniref:Uncharacterized protein n=1 Tax=hydrothermal vent metagenome TaxID=652676 RepID=A0A3B0Z564_9ZZZZ